LLLLPPLLLPGRFVGQAVGFITTLVGQLMGEAMADTSRHSDSEYARTCPQQLNCSLYQQFCQCPPE
jgi:hypothetical protein